MRAISGASAGAIAASILGACLKYKFPHRRLADTGDGSNNPLYDCWVNMIDIKDLLKTRDLEGDRAPVSLLDSTRILEIAQKAIDYGEGVDPISRPYLGNPLRFIFTTTNLRGVPFEMDLYGTSYHHSMMMHGDTMRFALSDLGGTATPPLRSNEYPLAFPPTALKWDGEWKSFAVAALASGAFPAGLAPRELSRRTSDYCDLPVVLPGGPNEPASIVTIRPVWCRTTPPSPETYQSVNVDGGTIDNEPLELARIELAGGDPLARNDRNGLNADRAVVMIDPFVGPESEGPSSIDNVGLGKVMLSTLNALKNQSRFRPQDVALALNDTIYSRYLIAPVRKDKLSQQSGTSIACGSLGGFGGFMSIKFRQHDFFLGRRNCQRFLSEHLTLPENNVLFSRWTPTQKQMYATLAHRQDGTTETELPIIPLMHHLNPKSDARVEEPEPDWPSGAFDPGTLEEPIEKRLDALFNAMAHETKWAQKLRGFLFSVGWRFYASPKLTNWAVDTIKARLVRHGL